MTSAMMMRGFSCPHEGLATDLFEAIATEHAAVVLEQFVTTHAGLLRTGTGGVVGILERACTGPMPMTLAWDPIVGDLLNAVRRADPHSAPAIAVQAAMRLHEAGQPGSWYAPFVQPVCFRWASLRLPPAWEISVTTTGNEAAISLRTDDGMIRATLEHRGGMWHSDDLDPLPVVHQGNCSILLLDDLDGWKECWSVVERAKIPATVLSDYIADAVCLIGEHAPMYEPWVGRVVGGIVALSAAMGQMISGSTSEKPGIIACSFPCSMVQLAETMIHEGSHQYFQLATRMGGVDDGSDARLYYSPFKQDRRPIDKILLAYHAFANVLLFYRSLLEGKIRSGGYIERSEAQLRGQVAELERHLRETTALTELGRDLWEPLAALIGDE